LETPYASDGIGGWMTANELRWLAERAKDMDSAVEIGSWKGRSTCVLLAATKGTVWAIDPWRDHCDSYTEFCQNTHPYPNLIIMKMRSGVAANYFPEKSVDMVFIDGNHDYRDVKNDILKWTPIARKLICGHDYFHPKYPNVKHAVDKYIGEVGTVENIWYKEL
jgi:predicted O-methyltransferase YrrM